MDKLGARSPGQFVCGQAEHNKIETHGVNECGGENGPIDLHDSTAGTRNPRRGQEHAYR
jgi:hypothetical protein